MKTRREFLAGIGMGASALALPSVAFAGGRRRRRQRCCECGHYDCTQPHPRAFQGTYGMYACPLSLTGGSNGVYYYYCCYCPGCGSFVTAPSSNPSLTPPSDPCSDTSRCIGYPGFSKSYPGSPTSYLDFGFYLNPADPQQSAFKNGLDSLKSKADTDTDFQSFGTKVSFGNANIGTRTCPVQP